MQGRILSDQELVFSETQKRVINHEKGHLRIVACPGSGKTEIVSQRVAELIRKGTPPSEIVAFTFTEKASEGLKLRIRRILEKKCKENSDFGEMYIGTIDSFCLHLLKQLKPEYRSFEVLDQARRTAFVDRWFYLLGLDSLRGPGRGKWRVIRTFCESADLVMMERIKLSKLSNKDFVECYKAYREKLEEERFFDFTSIIYTLLEILKNEKNTLSDLKKIIKHVVFDEYQDVNKLQDELLEQLSKGSTSVCVVGDDDQNIFQWRGSNVNYIINFPDKYQKYGVTTEKLDVNYRATARLVSTAENFIQYNGNRVPKNMIHYKKQTRKFETGDIVHHHFDTDEEEFDFILQNINGLLNTDFTDKYGETYALSHRDMAVLVTSNEDAARIIRFFEENNVPCIADSGTSVFERPLVAFATDCISFVFGCEGYTTGNDVPELEDLTRRYSDILDGNVKLFEKNLLEVQGRADRIIAKGYGDWLPDLGLQEFFQRILSAMGAEEGVFNEVDMYNLAVLSSAISDYEYVYQTLRAREVSGLKWFISQFAESNYSDPRHEDPTLVNAVRVLTIWKAKGLEFPVVFVPTFVKKKKPPVWQNFVDSNLYNKARYDGNIEDDRRAFYTAITRSQKYLFLTGAKKRRIVVNSKPSKLEILPHPFLDEMRNGYFSSLRYVSKPKSKYKPLIHSEGSFPTSYSELSIYERCPYDYQFRHVLGFSAGVPAAFGYGTNIHNILNLIHNNYIKKQTVPDDKKLGGIFDSMFYLRFAPGTQNENMKKAGFKVVKSYVDLHKQDFKRILETEKRFEFVMGKALISGDIDLLKKVNDEGKVTEVEIIDFKTEREKEDGQYELDHSEQVRFYSYATRLSLGYKPEKALIHHLDTHKKEYVDISDKRLEQTKSKIEKKVDEIMEGNFQAAPEKTKCLGCDFRSICSFKGFNVGVNFKSSKSSKRKGTTRPLEETTVTTDVGAGNQGTEKTFVSEETKKRAKLLAASNVIQNDGKTFQVRSGSDPSKSYRVTENRCDCRGFRNYSARHPNSAPTCSHLEAVRIFKKNKR